jgi:RNA polymerase sigma-70 factor (ECF subfamily)
VSTPATPADAQPSLPPDSELVARARNADQRALSDLLTRYQHRLFGVCLRMLGTSQRDRQTAADLTQDALVKIIQGLPQFDSQSQFSTWAIRVTMNVVLSHLRSQAVRKQAHAPGLASPHEDRTKASTSSQIPTQSRTFAASEPVSVGSPGAGSLAPEQSGPSSVQHHEELASVAAALAKLPTDHRAILVLRDVRGLEYDQIALVLGVEPGTVKSRLFRARVALRSALDPVGTPTTPPPPPTR